jgi:hypothetical protein
MRCSQHRLTRKRRFPMLIVLVHRRKVSEVVSSLQQLIGAFIVEVFLGRWVTPAAWQQRAPARDCPSRFDRLCCVPGTIT